MSAIKKLHWGLIGCGDIARKRVAPALNDLPACELVAVSRANFEKAESFAREFGAKRWYRDWQELLADEEIEAIYIATPVYLHVEQTVASAEAGKHVLCEKPMAMSTSECDHMIAACEANHVQLGVAYYRHHYPAIDRIKEILRTGEVGRAVIAQVNAFERFAPAESHPRRWLLEKDFSGGGPMMDFGCHRIEVLINLFGHVKEIKSLVDNVLFDREVEDTSTALLQFEDGPQATLSVTHAAAESQDTLDIFCSCGSIHIAALNEGKVRVRTDAGERIEVHPPHANLHQPLIADFTEAVLNDRAPQVDAYLAREVARVNEEIYRKCAK
ncbi:MAG TPA: Gfo/Idh/MocA family oxidoreductase [Pyrinomonadaceae bacterium]|nr:Gfo/Idh/MocA family oxidoreductase [Pyrinomonadaceae bacterium]